jgi:hypothetical protein
MEKYYGPIELAVVFGLVLALLIYDLVKLRRTIRRDAANDVEARTSQKPD